MGRVPKFKQQTKQRIFYLIGFIYLSSWWVGNSRTKLLSITANAFGKDF